MQGNKEHVSELASSFHQSSSRFDISASEETELAVFDGGGVWNNLRRRKAGNHSKGSQDNEEDENNKISRVAYVDMPLQFRMEEQQLGFSSNSRLGVNSTMVLSPQWTGTLASFADIRGDKSGYTQAKVELDYEIPPSSLSKVVSWCEKASLNVGVQARGCHQVHVEGKVALHADQTTPYFLRKRIGPTGDLNLSARYTQWLNHPIGNATEPSIGETTLSASQKYGIFKVQSTYTIPNNWWSAVPTLDLSISSLPSYHPWIIKAGWRLKQKDDSILPYGSISLTPKLSDILSLHFNAAWTWSRGLTTTCLWKQDLSGKPSSAASLDPLPASKPSREKSLQLGVQTNWMIQRTAALFVWTDSDFRLRIPIGIVPSSNTLLDSWSFSLQTMFLTILTRVIQDGLADMFHLRMVQIQAQETEQQQSLLRRQKAREDAIKQQHLMNRQAQNRIEEEGEIGLVIQKALYGIHLHENDESIHRPETEGENPNSSGALAQSSTATEIAQTQDHCLDVTVPLQFWVQQGQLDLPAMSKRNLLGFCDPRPLSSYKNQPPELEGSGERSTQTWTTWWKGFVTHKKDHPCRGTNEQSHHLQLFVRYRCGGFLYEITIEDEEGMTLPHPHAVQVTETVAQ